jgi:hypothetical protein
MRIDDGLRDVQAQAETAVVLRRDRALEAIEDARLVGGADRALRRVGDR